MGRVSLALVVLFFVACDSTLPYEEGADAAGHTSATRATRLVNEQSKTDLPLGHDQDFSDAQRGLIAQDDSLKVRNKDDLLIWDRPAYQFIDKALGDDAPASVNPSLWRQAKLNNIHGLFQVTRGIYQLRGYDLANMTIIETPNSWVIVDPLTSIETASRALSFAKQHLAAKPISAIIFTHSHIDHFGGVQGVLDTLSEGELQGLRIIAPEGFMAEASSENMIAGSAMSRRAMFMYGKRLARSERGHVDSGLGKGPAFGSVTLVAPTELIGKTPTEIEIDGERFVFQFTPDSEAPAEFTFYLPSRKVFCGAELVSRTLHNLYTLRGAKVRDALAWSGFIDEARTLFAEAEVYFASHHWPMWGQSAIQDFLAKQRDTYKYIHDQTVRMMNSGLSPNEIAEQLTLPKSLQVDYFNRGYYGTVKHNAKAVYQAYMGWFTANPAMLDPLPEVETATRTIALMGGVQSVVQHAEKAFEKISDMPHAEVTKEYRWLAQLLNMAVFAEPDNGAAKRLLAKVYDQLGYVAESAAWRDFYLSAAYELRHGPPDEGFNPASMTEVLKLAPVEKLFESMAVNLNGPEADGASYQLEVYFRDLEQRYILVVENAVLRFKLLGQEHELSSSDDAVRLSINHVLFIDVLTGNADLKTLLLSDELKVEGSTLDLIGFLALFEKQEGVFNIVTP